jgi:hypothetical protein
MFLNFKNPNQGAKLKEMKKIRRRECDWWKLPPKKSLRLRHYMWHSPLRLFGESPHWVQLSPKRSSNAAGMGSGTK